MCACIVINRSQYTRVYIEAWIKIGQPSPFGIREEKKGSGERVAVMQQVF